MDRGKSLLRNEDERLMRLISDFLDKNFYCQVADTISRHEDKETQLKGIDISFNLKDKPYLYNCDEKAAVRYINKQLKTFSLELSFINRKNVPVDGWLISHNSDNDNNSYLFIWVDKADSDTPQTINEIHDVEVALVRKSKIIEYLNSLGWTKEKLITKNDLIRENEYEELGNLYRDGVKFSISRQLVEQPINVLLSRDTYLKIADFHKRIVC